MEQNSFVEIKRQYASFSETERKIADVILRDPAKVIQSTTKALAAEAGVSEGSVINFSSQLGMQGFTRLKLNLARYSGEGANPLFDGVAPEDSPKDAFRKLMESAVSSFRDTFEVITAEEFARAAQLLMGVRKRVDVYGVGSSSMIAEDAAFRMMRIGIPAYGVTDVLLCPASAFLLDSGCAAVGISYSGATKETLLAMETAKKAGAATLCITAHADSPMAKLCDVSLLVRAREAEQNREAVTARLTQQLLIDSLCTYISTRRQDESLRALDHIVETIEQHR